MCCIVVSLDDLHLSLECDAFGLTNKPNPWIENSQFLGSV